MDKVIGRALLDGLVPLGERILCVSGRLSFELVQKAAVAGAPILVGVGAPSSLAISLAADRGITLCGFARRGDTNVYSHAGARLSAPAAPRLAGQRFELLLGGPRAGRGPHQPEGGNAPHDETLGAQALDLGLRILGLPGDERRAPPGHDLETELGQPLCQPGRQARPPARAPSPTPPPQSTSSEASAQALRSGTGKPWSRRLAPSAASNSSARSGSATEA